MGAGKKSPLWEGVWMGGGLVLGGNSGQLLGDVGRGESPFKRQSPQFDAIAHGLRAK